jgi:hypothetical protein
MLPICNLPKARKIPEQSRAPAAIVPAKSSCPDLPALLPAAPEQLVAIVSGDGAQEIRNRREKEGGAAIDRGVDIQ